MPKAFISYRREDAKLWAGLLYERLESTLGAGNVFLDVDTIPAGTDFRSVIKNSIKASDVVFVVIGPRWLELDPETGQSRLQSPKDFVRFEIEEALRRRKRIIPLFVDDAPLPSRTEIPASIVSILKIQSIRLSFDRFRSDVDRILRDIDGRQFGTVALEPVDQTEPSDAAKGDIDPDDRHGSITPALPIEESESSRNNGVDDIVMFRASRRSMVVGWLIIPTLALAWNADVILQIAPSWLDGWWYYLTKLASITAGLLAWFAFDCLREEHKSITKAAYVVSVILLLSCLAPILAGYREMGGVGSWVSASIGFFIGGVLSQFTANKIIPRHWW